MNKWKLFAAVLLLVCTPGSVFAQQAGIKSAEIINIEGRNFYLHKVAKGETLYSLSKLYGVTTGDIERDNPSVKENGLKYDEVVKIACREIRAEKLSPRKEARLFTEHAVLSGETTYSIARNYGISITTLVQDNPGLDPAQLSAGQTLRIRKSEIKETSPREVRDEIDNYAATLSSVSDGYIYYAVDLGETIYSISRKFNVPESLIIDNNDVAHGLQAGVMLKIPVSAEQQSSYIAAEKAKTVQTPGSSGKTEELTKNQEKSFANDLLEMLDGLPATQTTGKIELSDEYNALDPEPRRRDYLNISMLLPLTNESQAVSAKNNFVELYQGALLALEDLKNLGYTVNLNLFDTKRAQDNISMIVNNPDFIMSDLIIGPVYEHGIYQVADFAQRRNIPVVSPLATMENGYGGLFYQLAPSQITRYEKLGRFFSHDRNIVFVTAEKNDKEFESEMKSLANGLPYRTITFSKNTFAGEVDAVMANRSKENIFVVVADVESVDPILASISSVQNNRLARSISTGAVRVIGNAKWMRYNAIDKGLMFKLNVSFLTNYYADRGNSTVNEFYMRYMMAFGEVPTQYSFRGYDAVKLFGVAILNDSNANFNERLNNFGPPLQANYHFKTASNGNFVNTDWVLVEYNSDYTISVQ